MVSTTKNCELCISIRNHQLSLKVYLGIENTENADNQIGKKKSLTIFSLNCTMICRQCWCRLHSKVINQIAIICFKPLIKLKGFYMYLIYSQLLCKYNLLNHKFPIRKIHFNFIEYSEMYKSTKGNSTIYSFISKINR